MKPPVTTVFVGNISERAPDTMIRLMLQVCCLNARILLLLIYALLVIIGKVLSFICINVYFIWLQWDLVSMPTWIHLYTSAFACFMCDQLPCIPVPLWSLLEFLVFIRFWMKFCRNAEMFSAGSVFKERLENFKVFILMLKLCKATYFTFCLMTVVVKWLLTLSLDFSHCHADDLIK